jgi:hypothetical protein
MIIVGNTASAGDTKAREEMKQRTAGPCMSPMLAEGSFHAREGQRDEVNDKTPGRDPLWTLR